MSIAKHARCSQIIRNVENGHYVRNNKFRGYDPNTEIDRPSWDFRPRVIKQKINVNPLKGTA